MDYKAELFPGENAEAEEEERQLGEGNSHEVEYLSQPRELLFVSVGDPSNYHCAYLYYPINFLCGNVPNVFPEAISCHNEL